MRIMSIVLNRCGRSIGVIDNREGRPGWERTAIQKSERFPFQTMKFFGAHRKNTMT